MHLITCSAHPSAGARLTKPAAIPHTPLIPVFSLRPLQPRLPHAAGFPLGEQAPQGPFSFITDRFAQGPFNRPDVPKAASGESDPRQAAVSLQPDDSPELLASTGQPRFRSALEQVSYLTNQTAMRKM